MSDLEKCPICGSENIEHWIEKERFNYGAEKDQVELSAHVLVLVCKEKGCGFGWTDYRAEKSRQKAVDYHNTHKCAVCSKNWVDTDAGYDTCDSCQVEL